MKKKISIMTLLMNVFFLVSLMTMNGCLLMAKDASGPAFKMKKSIPNDKAVLYFYRPSKALGAALTNMGIVDNDVTICDKVLMNGYCVYIADPGKHTLYTDTIAVDKVTEIEINPGDKLYFKAIHHCEIWACFYSLTLVEESEAIKEIASYKLQE